VSAAGGLSTCGGLSGHRRTEPKGQSEEAGARQRGALAACGCLDSPVPRRRRGMRPKEGDENYPVSVLELAAVVDAARAFALK
jgi:hypothetical protein